MFHCLRRNLTYLFLLIHCNSLPGPAGTLGVSNEVIFLSISLFVVGFGVGPLVFAPMSEVVGRRIIYAISMFFCKYMLDCGVFPNFD